MEYCIVRASELQKLVDGVQELLLEGWELQGGVVMDNWKGWAQALIKRVPEGD